MTINNTQIPNNVTDLLVDECVRKRALEQAVRENLIRTNPAVGCKLPPKRGR